MFWTIIIIILVLWVLGAFGGRFYSRSHKGNNWIHSLLVIAIVLFILKLLEII